ARGGERRRRDPRIWRVASRPGRRARSGARARSAARIGDQRPTRLALTETRPAESRRAAATRPTSSPIRRSCGRRAESDGLDCAHRELLVRLARQAADPDGADPLVAFEDSDAAEKE